MPDGHSEFVGQVEAAKLIGDAIATAIAALEQAHGCAQIEYGLPVHGHAVNPPLVDLYRELDEAARACTNARNALHVLQTGGQASEWALRGAAACSASNGNVNVSGDATLTPDGAEEFARRLVAAANDARRQSSEPPARPLGPEPMPRREP